jgi:dihydropteroate synthase
MTSWLGRGLTLADGLRARVMGIVNVTPDSFSDGGRSATFDAAMRVAEQLVAEGADLIDVGGESSRPGAAIVPLEEELARVIPVVEALARRFSVPISVDTTKPEVARRALGAGAAIINDIRGLDDPSMVEVVAGSEAGVVLMHMQGTPQTMQIDPRYEDVVLEVHDELARRVEAAVRRGISRSRIAIDPGIGFGKTHEHNLALLRNLEAFAGIGCTLLVGTSRKGFLGLLTGRPRAERVVASVASALAAVAGGAGVVRVHDVGPTVDALKVWEAQRIRPGKLRETLNLPDDPSRSLPEDLPSPLED